MKKDGFKCMAEKYLKGGALNPAWCDEQDTAIITEEIMDGLANLFNNLDIELGLQFGEGIDLTISNRQTNIPSMMNNMCTIIDAEKEYEAKFNFIKNHSATPEDLQLAKEIVGLK
jgi:hypothetical protein